MLYGCLEYNSFLYNEGVSIDCNFTRSEYGCGYKYECSTISNDKIISSRWDIYNDYSEIIATLSDKDYIDYAFPYTGSYGILRYVETNQGYSSEHINSYTMTSCPSQDSAVNLGGDLIEYRDKPLPRIRIKKFKMDNNNIKIKVGSITYD